MNTTNSSKPRVPKRFELFNHTIRVKQNPSRLPLDCSGEALYNKNEINIYTYDTDPAVLEHVFYHELVHFLLHYAGRQDLSDDEILVDTLGGLLAQYEATKRP